jgi:hypothetical protein
MADILFYFLIITGLYLALISYWLVAEALFPDFVESCRLKYETSPLASTGVGLIVAAIILVLGGGIAAHVGNPLFKMLGLSLIFIIILMGFVGSTGLCRQIGLGLGSPNDEAQPWRRVLRGGVVLGLTFLLPFVGWFAVMPWALVSGLGVFVRAWLMRRAESKVQAAIV